MHASPKSVHARMDPSEYPAAGAKQTTKDPETCIRALQPDIYNPTSNPCATFRHRSAHFVPDITHGVSSSKSESVKKCLVPREETLLTRFLTAKAEEQYKSSRDEPIGKSREYGYLVPPVAHAYGAKTQRTDVDLICMKLEEESEEAIARYKKTHHRYAPGESINREYVLPQEVTESFAYGAREKPGGESSIKDSLDWSPSVNSAFVESDRQRNFNDATCHPIGRKAASMHCPPNISVTHTFGKPNPTYGDTVADCIRNCTTSISDLLPDPNLGKSKRVGVRPT